MDLKEDYTGRLGNCWNAANAAHPSSRKSLPRRTPRARPRRKNSGITRVTLCRNFTARPSIAASRLSIEIREAVHRCHRSDFAALLKEFPAPTVVLWHDTGHAQIKHDLGFIRLRQVFSPTTADRSGGLPHSTAVKISCARSSSARHRRRLIFARALTVRETGAHPEFLNSSPKVPLESAKLGIFPSETLGRGYRHYECAICD